MKKLIQRWLGITKLSNRINTLSDLINALDAALEHHTVRIREIDEDVSAEIRQLEDLAQWNLVKGNKNDK